MSSLRRSSDVSMNISGNATSEAGPTGDTDTAEDHTSHRVQQELPFLVTHWLANYGQSSNLVTSSESPRNLHVEQHEAVVRIRRASSEIASAFATLGAYGTRFRPSLGSSSFSDQPVQQNSTYSDIHRQHRGLPAKHLEHLAKSVLLHNDTANTTAMDNARANLLVQASNTMESHERSNRIRNNDAIKSAVRGRTLQDAIRLDQDDESHEQRSAATSNSLFPQLQGSSILQNPSLLLIAKDNSSRSASKVRDTIYAERSQEPLPSIKVKASQWDIGHETAEAMRHLLDLRERIQCTRDEIRSLKSSLTAQRQSVRQLDDQAANMNRNVTFSASEKLSKAEELNVEQQRCDRVINQVERKLQDVHRKLQSDVSSLALAEKKAFVLQLQRRSMTRHFKDPFAQWKGPVANGSRVGGCGVVRMILDRQFGLSRRTAFSSDCPMRSNLRTGIVPSHFVQARREIISTRLSHAVTINTHLDTPVYCLRFDRTGQYFITGADDYLVKVFCLGAAQSCRTRNEQDGSRHLRCNYAANFRGAVLVCSLRGHAGVINDIDVSSDNCFLATASTDQDVRVWGLQDGCPIAILRGHKNGANMVSWSTLTPFRLVTTACDGFARVWDVREACLKRYGKFVGKREEYIVRLTEGDLRSRSKRDGATGHGNNASRNFTHRQVPEHDGNTSGSRPAAISGAQLASGPPALPPLPAPTEGVPLASLDNQNDNIGVEIPAPPLPGAGPTVALNADSVPNEDVGAEGNEDEIIPGDFVMNDFMDEGVKLVSKYQHGSDEALQHGPGTRSTRAAVNVLCVTRCPLGNQFATGSDDGIVRVWQDFDDNSVASVDSRHSQGLLTEELRNVGAPASGIVRKPLLKLTGHVSTITDLSYSHAGDRILSGSQKDGVVRIWNVGCLTSSSERDKAVTQIVIKLIDPSAKKPIQASRRRPGNSTTTTSSKVSCEVAVWTHDDSMVATSQCVLLKQTGSDIQPGSQFIFLWSSRDGQCLLGISGAHTMKCNVISTHPLDSTILCTASDDGTAKVWDLTRGKCIFSYQNKVEHGPIDPNNGGDGQFLEGLFSPDGNVVVLTDSSGQVTVFDSIPSQEHPSNHNGNALVWMREQYFSNDYYELFYDTNGYCIEKGSQRPPHVAPKSRCLHNGSHFPEADDITETFKNLVGPLPLPSDVCRWKRDEIRSQQKAGKATVASSVATGVRISVREFDPFSTLLIRGTGHSEENEDNVSKRKRQPNSITSLGRNTHRILSNRFNYLGYEDLLMREGLEDDESPDPEDEEFKPAAPSAGGRRLSDFNDSEEENDDDENMSFGSHADNRRRGRSRGDPLANQNAAQRSVRAQRRAQLRNEISDFVEIDSDDDMIAQFVSANTTPKGPYLRDYTVDGHLWKLKSEAAAREVHRKWLLREDSNLSYFGKKSFAPQVGDSIVYIPRAHYETIKDFPTLSPPWQDWPTDAVWPIVRCNVQNIRYRFPYADYFRKGSLMCRSIVAIVTLQVTGVPAIDPDRDFPWPNPKFAEPSTSGVFEVPVFESDYPDFLLPEFLYTNRLEALERHCRENGGSFIGLQVDLFYGKVDLYGNGPRREDAQLEPWGATLSGVAQDDLSSDVHLNDSGFGVLSATGSGNDIYEDNASPWEVNTEGLIISRPRLSAEESEVITKELNSLLNKPRISDYFRMPVDQGRYYDYGVMIEIPMDLMFVKRRLRSGYYGSKLAVVADLRLIRDNCIKYNTAENEISEVAVRMCEEFESKILTPEERSQLLSEQDFEKIREDQSDGRQTSNLRIRLSARTIQRAQQANSASISSGARYTLRDRSEGRRGSSLESLPAPASSISDNGNERSLRRPRSDPVLRETRSGRRSLREQRAGNRSETLARLQIVASREERAARRSRVSVQNDNDAQLQNGNSANDTENPVEMTLRGTRRSLRSRDRPDQPSLASVHTTEEVEIEKPKPMEEARGVRSSSRISSVSCKRTRQLNEEYSEEEGSEEEDSEEEDSEEEDSEENNEELSDGDEEQNESLAEHLTIRSDGDSDSEEVRPKTWKRNCDSKSGAQRSTRYGRARPQTTSDSPGRRSRRQTTQRPTYKDVETSDVDEYGEETSGKEDNEVEIMCSGRSRTRKSASHAEASSEDLKTLKGNTPSKRKSRGKYTDETSDNDDKEEEILCSGRSRNRKSVSNAEASPGGLETSKRNSASTKRKSRVSTSLQVKPAKKSKSEKSSDDVLPSLAAWPEIEMSEITQVANVVLGKVADQDYLSLFAAPVVETYPDIKDAYSSMIKEPMDLRTIKEERIPVYCTIKQLQDDLILMYSNCCTFNKSDLEYWKYAKERWEDLNRVFSEVCKDLHVLLPRRWNS